MASQPGDTPSSSHLYRRALEYAGVPVEHRPIEVGEDLSDYAGVIVCAVKTNSMAAFYNRYGALYAATQLPHLIAPDDWQIRDCWNGWHPEYIWKYPTDKMRTPKLQALMDKSSEFKQQLWNLIEDIAAGHANVMLNCYNWGDHERLKRLITGNIRVLDLSPFTAKYHVTQMGLNKSREWVLAQLLDPRRDRKGIEWHDRVLASGWPIRAFHATVKSRDRKWKVPEITIVTQHYAQCWGVLSRPYPHAGSGWWRLRFHQAIEAGCILSAAPEEVRPLGISYLHSPSDITQLGDAELLSLANYQAEVFTRWQGTQDSTASDLLVHLKAIGFNL